MLNRLSRKTNKVWYGIKSLSSQIHLHSVQAFLRMQTLPFNERPAIREGKLGHRNIQNTMVYTQLVEWDQPDQWTVRRPITSKEEDELIEVGFEYVRFDDKLNVPIYRKRK